MRPFLISLLILAVSLGHAQTYGGTYTGDSGAGPVRLELVERGTDLTGVLTGPALRFELEGFVDTVEGVAAGAAFSAEGTIGFEAYLEGDTLGLYLFEMTADGEPVMASVIELILRRTGPPAPPTANPLAPADPFLGTFADGVLTLRLEGGSGGPYEGRIEFGGQVYPARATSDGRALRGAFTSAGQDFPFTAAFDGPTLTFETGGATYRLAPAAPAAGPTVAPGPGARASSGGDPVLADGAHGRLTLDNALAFIEAVEFALAQAGYPYRFSASERDELLSSFTAAYPLAAPVDQAVLAQAREIWANVQANWPQASEEDRRQFVLGVFALFFGEEAVAQWATENSAAGPSQGGGGAHDCGSFDECASAYVDERTWTETFNSQGCWASAGCSDYSPEVGFTFESYD